MLTQKNQSSRFQTGYTGWSSIHINDSESTIDLPSGLGGSPQRGTQAYATEVCHLFEHMQQTPASLPERFPRLTILAIALVFFASVLMAEFDYLRSAGYYWP
jgi:hypothetical protein